ncbi:PRAME family member 12-like [Erinaceus europaeus]|uniref:PRAME family member 12-like n=1 Tax=Erinaceus europaeus TaxID=9365 RepID=A0ABM3YBB3_ERIEU|nr:PRAME family member 12-like [Erinaceus europaeus]
MPHYRANDFCLWIIARDAKPEISAFQLQQFDQIGMPKETTCDQKQTAGKHSLQALQSACGFSSDLSSEHTANLITAEYVAEKITSCLLLLAIQRLLRDEYLAISYLRSLPAELFPCLFLEAYTHKCWKTMKALVQSWPFDRLPLEPLVYDLFPDNESLKSVLDGIDVLLQQEVLPSCKLQVLDLQSTGEKFWSVWTGDYFPVCSLRKQLEAEGPSRNENARPCLETFGQFLGRMKNLSRLCLEIIILEGVPSNELENQNHLISEFTSKILQLLRLQELYLESVSFLQGHLDQLLRSLQTQLEVFSLIDCTVTERDLAHLFQSPHIRQLKELCLRGIPLTSVSEPLGALLEVNAATLQDLDLSLCGLQDPQLEALLPALSICSQLRSLNLHGNRLSMAILEKLLHCTTGLQHLCLQLFPAPLESSNPQGVPQSWVLDLLCTQISNILQHLGYSRSIMMSSCHCSHCARKEFRNWEPTFIPCSHLYETHYGELKAIVIPFRIIRSGI